MEWVYNETAEEPTVYETPTPPKSPTGASALFNSLLAAEEPVSEPDTEPEYYGDALSEQLISPIAAFETFAGRVFRTHTPPDFSGSIYAEAAPPPPPRATGAPARPVLPAETRAERIARLQHEVSALAQETGANKAAEDGEAASGGEFAALREQLAQIEQSIAAAVAPASTRLLRNHDSVAPSSDAPRAVTVQVVSARAEALAALEARVGRLEASVGAPPPAEVGDAPPLWGLVVDVTTRLALLRDPRLPAALKRDARDIAGILQRELQEERGADLLRTATILDKMERWQTLADQVPVVVERLRAFKRLQQEAACFADALAKIAAQVERLERHKGENSELIANVRRNLDTNLATVTHNLDVLQAKLEKD